MVQNVKLHPSRIWNYLKFIIVYSFFWILEPDRQTDSLNCRTNGPNNEMNSLDNHTDWSIGQRRR